MQNSNEWNRMMEKLVSGHYYELLDKKSMVCFDDGESIVLNKKEYNDLKANPITMFQDADNNVGFDDKAKG